MSYPSASVKTCSRSRGITVIELLVVLVVTGVVASIAIATFADVFDRSKQRSTMADMSIVARAIAAYSVDYNRLPSDAFGLNGLGDKLVQESGKRMPTRDHWGHDLAYKTDPDGLSYSVECFGKDGIDGHDYDGWDPSDYNADIVLFNGVFVAAPE